MHAHIHTHIHSHTHTCWHKVTYALTSPKQQTVLCSTPCSFIQTCSFSNRYTYNLTHISIWTPPLKLITAATFTPELWLSPTLTPSRTLVLALSLSRTLVPPLTLIRTFTLTHTHTYTYTHTCWHKVTYTLTKCPNIAQNHKRYCTVPTSKWSWWGRWKATRTASSTLPRWCPRRAPCPTWRISKEKGTSPVRAREHTRSALGSTSVGDASLVCVCVWRMPKLFIW